MRAGEHDHKRQQSAAPSSNHPAFSKQLRVSGTVPHTEPVLVNKTQSLPSCLRAGRGRRDQVSNKPKDYKAEAMRTAKEKNPLL